MKFKKDSISKITVLVRKFFLINRKAISSEIWSKESWPRHKIGRKKSLPVTKPVRKSHDPVVKLTEKSHDPVVKPGGKSHDPVWVPPDPVFRLILCTPLLSGWMAEVENALADNWEISNGKWRNIRGNS